MKKDYTTTIDGAMKMLGGMPEYEEIKRLIEYYPTYRRVHRQGFLQDILENEKPLTIAKNWALAKSVSFESMQSKGGHTKVINAKIRRFVRRIAYLRYRLDDDLSRREANQQILKNFDLRGTNGDIRPDSLARTVREDTRCQKLDKPDNSDK